ncbi:MAG: hypothetical protein AAF664_14505 [Planctomycetota bacterium]
MNLFLRNQTVFERLVISGGFAFLAMAASMRHVHSQRINYAGPPINYQTASLDNVVSRLDEKLADGRVILEHDEEFGYLKSLLNELQVPVESQTLVFSKTSLQLRRISPRRPRAIYFGDEVYVGYCWRGDMLEIAVTDPVQGAIFYTLDQEPSDKKPSRMIRDRGACLSCHSSSRTQNVPGYLVRSGYVDGAGHYLLGRGSFLSDATSPFRERWGGWYVTGSHGDMRHMGNTISIKDDTEFDFEKGANLVDLSTKFRAEHYLSPHSDLVALMVLEHQSQMHNAMAQANYESRRAIHQSEEMNELLERPKGYLSDSAKRRIEKAATNVLTHLLFVDEFPLECTVSGSSEYVSVFEKLGPFDSHGRTLRQFDLENRMFRYPCSYLIYSEAFAGLPEIVRNRVLERLAGILMADAGQANDQDNKLILSWADEERQVVHEILYDTLDLYAKRIDSLTEKAVDTTGHPTSDETPNSD